MSIEIHRLDCVGNLPDPIAQKISGKSVFLSEDYRLFLEKQGQKAFYLFSESFIMPVSVTKKYIFTYAELISEPFRFTEEVSENETEFLDSCMDYLRKQSKVQFVSCTPVYAFFSTYPTKSLRIPFGSHVIDLTQPEDTILGNMKPSCRQSIKTAQNQQVVVKSGGIELLADYIKIDKETWERSHIHTDHSGFYQEIMECLKNHVMILMAYKDDDPQGGAIYYYDQNCCYNLYGARKNHSVNGSNNLIHWEAIRLMKEKGVKLYSFVGARINVDQNSKFSGIQKFKESFGSELQQGYMFKVIFKPLMYQLHHRLISIKSKKPFQDIIDQEIDKWQDINLPREKR